jgi:hypothetical protein
MAKTADESVTPDAILPDEELDVKDTSNIKTSEAEETSESHLNHWYVSVGIGKPCQVPTLAVKVERLVAVPEIVGSTEFAG